MCDPVTIGVVTSLVGAGAGAYNTARTARKQDKIAAAGIRRQGELQREANRRLNETLTKFEESAPDEIKADLNEQFSNQIRLKRARALAGLQQQGGISDVASQYASDAEGTALNYADFLKGVFSRIDAPGEQRLREGFEQSDLASAIKTISRNSAGEDFVTRLRASSVQRNPWLDFLAAGLSGAGTGLARRSLSPSSAFNLGPAPAGTTVPGSILPPAAFYQAASGAGRLPGMTASSPAGLYGLYRA